MTTLKSFKELAALREQLNADGNSTTPRSDDHRDGSGGGSEGAAQPLRDVGHGDSVRPEQGSNHGFSVSEWAAGYARESEKPAPGHARRLPGGGEVDTDQPRRRGRIARRDGEPDGSNLGKSVAGRVWEYLKGNISTFSDFTYLDVVPHLGKDTRELARGVSAALARLHHETGNLQVVGKRRSLYVYRLVSLESPSFTAAKSHTEAGPRNVKRGTRHVLKQSDFTSGHASGRMSSGVPDMQSIQKERVLPPEVVERILGHEPMQMPDMDFTKVEDRIATTSMEHGMRTATEAMRELNRIAGAAPAAMRRLVAALEAVKIEILVGYSDEDLLNELIRRKK